MAYGELIKNFEHIRSYMRDFFIYGFKTREEYDKKSARSYDNERRRIQSYLGDLVSFRQTASGKNMFISLKGRDVTHNPLHKAFKSKSFTNKDITLHFIVMDILALGEEYTVKDMLGIIDEEYLSYFKNPLSFDESTLRKKLKEYEELGIISSKKSGKVVTYKMVEDDSNLETLRDAVRFFAEENPLGVVGSYIEDKMDVVSDDEEYLLFKNHYIMNAFDAEVLEVLLQGIHEKRWIEITTVGRRSNIAEVVSIVPCKIFISTQGGRDYILGKKGLNGPIFSYRIDYIRKVSLANSVKDYDLILQDFTQMTKHMWGVTYTHNKKPEHFEMDIHVGEGEEFIYRRLVRERRCGEVIKVDDSTYRYVADVCESNEMLPWIRTFFGRIKAIECDNEEVVNRLKADMVLMAKQYEVDV